jgi:iron complex outermembrane receptor protein
LPSWTRLDLGASYLTRVMGRDLTLRARIDNVANRGYWASAGGYPGSGYLVLGAPRTVAVSGTIDF